MRAQTLFGSIDIASAAIVALGVFVGLPARWWPIDVTAAIVIALNVIAGIALVVRTSWSHKAARVASFFVLTIGLIFVALLAISASYLAGIYGPVGRGGAVIFALVIAIAIPYLIVLPASQLVWLGRDR